MILADTTVLIEQQKRPDPKRVQTALSFGAGVCGVTVAELYTGVRTPKDETTIRTILGYFQSVLIPDALWKVVGRNQARLTSVGVVVPLADTAIASVAIAVQVEVWTYDPHFIRMAAIHPGLQLFQEPP